MCVEGSLLYNVEERKLVGLFRTLIGLNGHLIAASHVALFTPSFNSPGDSDRALVIHGPLVCES